MFRRYSSSFSTVSKNIINVDRRQKRVLTERVIYDNILNIYLCFLSNGCSYILFLFYLFTLPLTKYNYTIQNRNR